MTYLICRTSVFISIVSNFILFYVTCKGLLGLADIVLDVNTACWPDSWCRFGSFEIFKRADEFTGRQGPSYGRDEIRTQMLDYVIETFYPEIHQNHSDRIERNTAFFREVDWDLFITFNNISAAVMVLIHWNARPFSFIFSSCSLLVLIFNDLLYLSNFGRLPSSDLALYPLRLY